MELISDGLLLAAAMAAIFYCWAISRRLGGLKQQSADLTTKLSQLDKTVSEVRAAIAEGRDLAASEHNRLSDLMVRADKLRGDLRRATTALEKAEPAKPAAKKSKDSSEALARLKRYNRAQKTRAAS